MPPKKVMTKSPYFSETPARKSTRISNASIHSSSRKRVALSSETDFEGDKSSGSNFQNTEKGDNNKRTKMDQSSEPEDDEEDSDEEARPPKTTIIPLPKAREAGDTPYQDDRIHENTMLFLKDLKANNNREWMRCIPHLMPYLVSFSDNITAQSTTKIFAIHREILRRLLNNFPPWSRKGIILSPSCLIKTLYVGGFYIFFFLDDTDNDICTLDISNISRCQIFS
jgi:hypothetical protein